MSGVLADSGVSFSGVGAYLTTAKNWWGYDGLIEHIRDHVIYSVIIVVLATLIALPIGLAVGHSGRGVVGIVGVANGLRAIPTLGLAVLFYVWVAPKIPVNHTQVLFLGRGGVPTFIVVVIGLVVLAIPPILTNTYAGIQAVEPAARDAARGMGMTGWQMLWRVEFPCALPLILSGLRSATLQVIATVTVAAYLPGLGGLGRYIIDGSQQGQSGYPAMLTAAILVAVLAVIIDGLLNAVQRVVVSPGVSGRFSSQPGVTTAPTVEVELTAA